jgi:uncharacterized protein YjaG (DUF416 family)
MTNADANATHGTRQRPKGIIMPSYVAIVQVTQEYRVAVRAKDDEAAYDKVEARIDNDTWKKYAVKDEEMEPDIDLLQVEEADPDIDDFVDWIK